MEQGCRGVETPSDYSHGVKVNDTIDTRRRRVALVSVERPEKLSYFAFNKILLQLVYYLTIKLYKN